MLEIVRKSCYLAATIFFLYAFLLTTSRVLTAFPEQLQSTVNGLLQDQSIQIEGLNTTWRFSNPVIEAATVELPYASLKNVVIEIAVIESLIRFQLVANRLFVEDVQLHIQLQDQLVQLNLPELIANIESGLEWIRHTDEISLAGDVRISRGDLHQTWFAHLSAVNQDGVHRYQASLRLQEENSEGGIEFFSEAVDTLFNLRPGNSRTKLSISALTLDPALLLGISNVTDFKLGANTNWKLEDDQTQGHLSFTLTDARDEQSRLDMHGSFRSGSGDYVRYRFDSPTLNTADSNVELPSLLLAADAESIIGTSSPTQLREALATFVEFLNANDEPVRWVSGLDLRGMLSNVAFVLDLEGVHWVAKARSIEGNQFQNVPAGFVSQAVLFGNQKQIKYDIENAYGSMFFASYFDKNWNFASMSGNGLIDYRDGELGMIFNDVELHFDNSESPLEPDAPIEVKQVSSADGSQRQQVELLNEPIVATLVGSMRHVFGGDPHYRVAFQVESKSSLIPSNQVLDFVPTAQVENIRKWQDEYVDTASFFGTTVAYLTYRDDVVKGLTRDIFLQGEFTNGSVTYDDAWPRLENLSGTWHLNNHRLRLLADRATVQNTELSGTTATFPLDDTTSFNVTFEATTQTNEVLRFVRASELQDWLPSIDPSWYGDGAVTLTGNLNFPMDVEGAISSADDEFLGEHEVSFELDDVSLAMPDLAIELNELNGTARWQSPYVIETNLTSGRFFDSDMVGSIETTSRNSTTAVEFRLSSDVRWENAVNIADIEHQEIGSGQTEFHANLVIYPAEDRATELFVVTDLAGMNIDLLKPFRDTPTSAYPTTLQLAMEDTQSHLTVQSRDVNGWLTLLEDSDTVSEGAIALGQSSVLPNKIPDRLHISGRLSEWIFQTEDEELLDAHVVFSDVFIERLTAFDTPFTDANVTGDYTGETFDLSIESKEFTGNLRSQGDGFYTEMNVSRFVWSADIDGENESGFEIATLSDFNPIKINIDELLLKADDESVQSWGEWSLTVMPREYGLEIAGLNAQTHGLEISASEPIRWRQDSNETFFTGSIHGEDLESILRSWDFDASAESESFQVDAAIKWSGSPFDLEIENTTGRIQVNATNGRFVDIDQGGDVLRLVSLLNFSKILNRLTLDFKDVTQTGLHFDEASVDIQIDDGLISFIEPLVVNGPGVRLDMDGTINTRTGELDSDLRVRIPLHKGLQTAATYLAAINPPATVSLLLSTWFISEPIKALLTANYDITGNLENPVISRVNVSTAQATTN